MGLGDEIMATADAKRLKGKFPDYQIVIGDRRPFLWTEDQKIIFRNNPNITPPNKIDYNQKILYLQNYAGNRPYIDKIKTTNFSDKIFFSKYKVEKGDIFFSDAEIIYLDFLKSKYSDCILLNPDIKGTFSGDNKDWGINNWKSLSERLAERGLKCVQSNFNKNNILNSCDVVDINSFREMCLLISACKLTVTTEGGVHHAAAALDKKAVVVFGGRTNPNQFGYNFHINFYVEHPLSPCGKNSKCSHCRDSMDNIKVERVEEEIYNLYEQT